MSERQSKARSFLLSFLSIVGSFIVALMVGLVQDRIEPLIGPWLDRGPAIVARFFQWRVPGWPFLIVGPVSVIPWILSARSGQGMIAMGKHEEIVALTQKKADHEREMADRFRLDRRDAAEVNEVLTRTLKGVLDIPPETMASPVASSLLDDFAAMKRILDHHREAAETHGQLLYTEVFGAMEPQRRRALCGCLTLRPS
jgi:hypothetical protein